jgi:protein-S-isoprenylcysteine O-methyltransferase Ste14
MNTFGQIPLGIIILCLLAMLVIVKQVSTGSILGDKPKGGFLIWVVNVFNLFFLLIVNPLAGILLVTRHMDTFDPTRITIDAPWLLVSLEIVGLILYVIGFFLMAWALITLGRNYQIGGNPPLASSVMIISGPYRLIRHPMYSAALFISLGLACLVQSLAYLAVFIIYLVLIIFLIPFEEEGLHRAYGGQYEVYRKKVGALLPLPRQTRRSL